MFRTLSVHHFRNIARLYPMLSFTVAEKLRSQFNVYIVVILRLVCVRYSLYSSLTTNKRPILNGEVTIYILPAQSTVLRILGQERFLIVPCRSSGKTGIHYINVINKCIVIQILYNRSYCNGLWL